MALHFSLSNSRRIVSLMRSQKMSLLLKIFLQGQYSTIRSDNFIMYVRVCRSGDLHRDIFL